MPVPLVVGQARVIRHRAQALVLEPRRQHVHVLARRAVDDAGLAAVPGQHLENLLLQCRPRQHAVEQIRPVERAHELER